MFGRSNFGRFIVFASLLLSLPTSASTDDDPFKRYDLLAARFPAAFREYVRRDVLIPMIEPRWIGEEDDDGDGADYEIEIDACATPAGRAAGPAARHPQIRVSFTSSRDEIVLSIMQFPSCLPPEYGWRVILAEVLLKFPKAQSIGLGFIADWPGSDLGTCAEGLSRGLTPLEAAQKLPVARVAHDFGFALTYADATTVDSPKYPSHFLGELSANLTLERVSRLH